MKACVPVGLALLHSILAAACMPAAAPSGPPAPPSATVAADEVTLTVFAAASLGAAFADIGHDFEAANPGTRVVFSFAGSQQLATQIVEGAPADVFASANRRQMDVVVAAGEAVSGTQRTFARNRLVVIYPADNPAGVRRLQDLAQPGLKLVLGARGVPVGGYALDFLQRASSRPEFTAAYSPTVLANVVSYEDDVKSVLGKVTMGEADAGIVYGSDAGGSADGAGSVAEPAIGRLEIPDDLNVIAAYPIAPLVRAANPTAAARFVAQVLSPEGQAVLARHGFLAVGASP